MRDEGFLCHTSPSRDESLTKIAIVLYPHP
jgi:hypothetical protein